MYNFVLQTIIMVSLGTIIYLIARAVPRVSETAKFEQRENYFDRIFKKLPIEKADAFVSMIMDNLLTKHLQKIRPGGTGGERPALFEKKEEDANN
jgi:hypothetical protein